VKEDPLAYGCIGDALFLSFHAHEYAWEASGEVHAAHRASPVSNHPCYPFLLEIYLARFFFTLKLD
jgi:hypothetical protein